MPLQFRHTEAEPGETEVRWLTLSPHCRKVPGSTPGSFWVETACSPRVCMGSLASSQFQKHAKVNWPLQIAHRCEWLSVCHMTLHNHNSNERTKPSKVLERPANNGREASASPLGSEQNVQREQKLSTTNLPLTVSPWPRFSLSPHLSWNPTLYLKNMIYELSTLLHLMRTTES